jgi:hypothetical protein
MLGDEAMELVEYSEDELASLDKDSLKAEIAILEGSSVPHSANEKISRT